MESAKAQRAREAEEVLTAILPSRRQRKQANVAECQMLLSRGADIRYRNSKGQTALFIISKEDHFQAWAALLAAGADVHAVDRSGDTALHEMASIGAACKLLLDSGADHEAKHLSDRTALHLVATYGQLAVRQLLIVRGADVCTVNAFRHTPLHFGAEHPGVCALLLDEGAQASVHALTRSGVSPLDCTTRCGDVSACRLLVAQCAPLPSEIAKLHDLDLPAAAASYLTAIRDAGWKRRLAAFRAYSHANGKWWQRCNCAVVLKYRLPVTFGAHHAANYPDQLLYHIAITPTLSRRNA